MLSGIRKPAEDFEGIRYLTVDVLVHINKSLIALQTPAELTGVLKPNELESSQQSPAMARCFSGNEDIFYLASKLMESLVKNHCFHNANKRTAAMAGFIFLMLNGYRLHGDGDDLITILLGIDSGAYDREELEAWMAGYSEPFDSGELNDRAAPIKIFAQVLMRVAPEDVC